MILLITHFTHFIHYAKRKTLKNIHKKYKYNMNNFYYINTLKRKRNEQLSYNKKNIKKLSGRSRGFDPKLPGCKASTLCTAIPCLCGLRR